jgi:hypothetical protein
MPGHDEALKIDATLRNNHPDSRVYSPRPIEGRDNKMALFNRHIKHFLSDWTEKLGSRWHLRVQKAQDPLNKRDIRAVGEGAVEAALFN